MRGNCPHCHRSQGPAGVDEAASSGLPRLSPYIVRVSYTLWQFAYPMGDGPPSRAQKRPIRGPRFVPGHEVEAAFARDLPVGAGKWRGVYACL